MQEENGIYKIPCEVNGLRMKFIFDTGASKVSLSLTEAKFMLDNDYISEEDIIGTSKSQIADGSIVENTAIIIREIKIANIVLNNIEAVVTHSMGAPLLLGQSAIQKLGAIQIDGNELIIVERKVKKTDAEIDLLFDEAYDAYANNLYQVASIKYQELYDYGVLSDYGLYKLGKSYWMIDNYKTAIMYLNKIKDYTDIDKYWLYNTLGWCYLMLDEYDNAIYNFELQSEFIDHADYEDHNETNQRNLATAFFSKKDYTRSIIIYEKLLKNAVYKKNLNSIHDKDLSKKYKDKEDEYTFKIASCKYLKNGCTYDDLKQIKNLATEGNKYAIEFMQNH